MQQLEIIGTFDSADTAAEVARALNSWFQWVMDGDTDEVPELFEDFGLSTKEYALDRDNDVDWEDPPSAEATDNHVVISAYTAETSELLEQLLESLGAYEVEVTEVEG